MLVAFDFHGTLTRSDMTVLLGAQKDEATRREMTGIAERARNGELDYVESLRGRVKRLQGLPEERVRDAYSKIKFRKGALEILGALSRTPHHVAIITSSFEDGVEAALDREGAAVDSVVANRLGRRNGALSGEVSGPLVEREKDAVLTELAARENVDLSQVVAVGNGDVDRPMLRVAGTAVGFRPASAVKPDCDVVVHSHDRLALCLTERGVLE